MEKQLENKKVLHLGKAQILFGFSLAFLLIRTFETCLEGTSARQSKEKQAFLLLCSRLFVPLHL